MKHARELSTQGRDHEQSLVRCFIYNQSSGYSTRACTIAAYAEANRQVLLRGLSPAPKLHPSVELGAKAQVYILAFSLFHEQIYCELRRSFFFLSSSALIQ